MAQIEPETRDMLEDQYAEAQPESDAQPKFFGVNRYRMDALLAETQQLEQKASIAALRMMDDVYRQTLHKAELAMAAGATTLPKAIDMAVADFLRAGITCIEYKDGRRVNIADYTEMALRTAATRAKLQGDAAQRAELGVDTVLVSQYGGCSETCLPWQGRVYIDDVFGAFNGERSGDQGHSTNGKWYPLLSVAVQNGLFHPNCRHTLSTWYEGVSTKPRPLDAAVVRNNAQLEQQQRALERKLRQAKRLEIGCTDPQNAKKYMQQRKAAQKELREFVAAHADVLRRDPWKEQVHTAPPAPEQLYRPVTRGEQDITMPIRPEVDVQVRAVETYNNVFISDRARIKPKALHDINQRTEAALKLWGIAADRKPKIVIVSPEELSAFGKYDPVEHVVYYTPQVTDEDVMKDVGGFLGFIEKHEMWHLKQAENFRAVGWNITRENYDLYLQELCKKAKKTIDKAGINEYNAIRISKYAYSNFSFGRFDEVEAEWMAMKGVDD